jgi:hypothetical protein
MEPTITAGNNTNQYGRDGFLLLFGANQSTSLVLGPFPPFGMITITILIVATYLVLTGIYVSATVLSSNTGLRRSIYKLAAESKLLDLLGRGEAGKGIEKAVTEIMKRTSIEYASTNDFNYELDEQELKNYLEKVMDELGKKKKE